MFKKILTEIRGLIPEDLTSYLALDLAKIFKGSLYFLITYEKEEELPKVENYLNKMLSRAEEKKIKSEAHLLKKAGLKELSQIIKEEKIKLAVLPLRDLKKSLKLPTTLVLGKFVHLGRLSPKRFLIILKEDLKRTKDYENFLIGLLKAYPHTRVYILSVGEEIKWSEFQDFLKKHFPSHDWENWKTLSFKKLLIKILTKRIDFLVFPLESLFFWQINKKRFIKNLLEKTPCNLIVFKPGSIGAD